MSGSAPTLVLRLRRVLALLLLAVAAVVAVVYLRQRVDTARQQGRRTPIVPIRTAIRETADTFELSGTNAKDGRNLYRISADKTDQLKTGSQYLLHHVRILVYAADGKQVALEIRGEQFAYDQKLAQAVAQGEVAMDWNSASAALPVGETPVPGAGLAIPPPPNGSTPAPEPIHMIAHDLVFDTATQTADVTQGIAFTYRTAQGGALEAHLQGKLLRLAGGVHLDWQPPAASQPTSQPSPVAAPAPVKVTADAAELDRDANTLLLSGAVHVLSAGNNLAADRMDLAFDLDRHLRHAVVDGHIRAQTDQPGRQDTVTAEHAVADFGPAATGGATEVTAVWMQGQVGLRQHQPTQNLDLTAGTLDALFSPGNRIRSAKASDHALAHMVGMDRSAAAAPKPGSRPAAPRSDTIAAPELDLVWNTGGVAPLLSTVDGVGRTHVEITGPLALGPATASPTATNAAAAPAGPVQLDADIFHLQLDAGQQPQMATAAGDVHITQPSAQPSSGPSLGTSLAPTTAQGELLTMHFAPGATTTNNATSNAQITELQFDRQVEVVQPQPGGGVRHLRADTLVYDAADGRLRLSAEPGSAWTRGRVSGSDPQSSFLANTAIVVEPPGAATSRVNAQGDVVLTVVSLTALGPAPNAAVKAVPTAAGRGKPLPVPVIISADRAQFDSLSDHPQASTAGSGMFYGHVRLWQGDSILYADQVTLDRARQSLAADGHVLTQFVAPADALGLNGASNNAPANSPVPGRGKSPAPAASSAHIPANPSAQIPVTIGADHLDYDQGSRMADYRGQVRLTDAETRLTSDHMQAWLADTGDTTAKASATASAAGGLERFLATGHVVATRTGETGKAEQLDYTSSTQIAKLTGGSPSICDAEHGCFRGDPLTFSQQDGAITIGSKNGSPASGQITIHR